MRVEHSVPLRRVRRKFWRRELLGRPTLDVPSGRLSACIFGLTSPRNVFWLSCALRSLLDLHFISPIMVLSEDTNIKNRARIYIVASALQQTACFMRAAELRKDSVLANASSGVQIPFDSFEFRLRPRHFCFKCRKHNIRNSRLLISLKAAMPQATHINRKMIYVPMHGTYPRASVYATVSARVFCVCRFV